MKKILVAVDGSECSQRAADVAASMASGLGASLTLLHVFPPQPLTMNELEATFSEIQREHEQYAEKRLRDMEAVLARIEQNHLADADKMLEKTKKVIAAHDARVDKRALGGSPAETVVHVAKTEGFDLIVVGTRGRGAIASMLLGSVANRILHMATGPVLVVR